MAKSNPCILHGHSLDLCEAKVPLKTQVLGPEREQSSVCKQDDVVAPRHIDVSHVVLASVDSVIQILQPILSQCFACIVGLQSE